MLYRRLIFKLFTVLTTLAAIALASSGAWTRVADLPEPLAVEPMSVPADNTVFVQQLYHAILVRPASAEEIQFWNSQLDSGSLSRTEVVEALLDEPEVQTEVAPVARLYLAALGRLPDGAGLAFWTEAFRQGTTLQQIAAEFINSTEFQQRYGTDLAGEAFIDLLYLNTLNRAADEAGKAHWLAVLEGGATPESVLVSFSESEEHQNLAEANIAVALTYQALRGRNPSDDELRNGVAMALPDLIAILFVPTTDYDPLEKALTVTTVENFEAVIPSQCYTKTEGISNPCWTCHTSTNAMNFMGDWDLQQEYAFSDVGLTNFWTNLFADRTEVIESISDEEILAYIRMDNYTPLIEALAAREDYIGWLSDLDYRQGFDEEGFANDGSWWRAFRYKPFLGTFWPTNGSTDDVIVRLPGKFWLDADGNASREIYKVNLAILEAAMTVPPDVSATELERRVEPISEIVAGVDLDGDDTLEASVDHIRGLPERYVGAANDEKVTRFLYPVGTEFIHTVRYVDPDSPSLLSTRLKELRYSRKVLKLDTWALLRSYEVELEKKADGRLPMFSGSPLVGLQNDFGWQLQGFIEDAEGRLRLQTDEEHRFCMGCHSTMGITVDQTFGFPRKVPGPEGWGHQDLAGIQDVPQAGHPDPEILTYFRRVQGGDEFRANDEILERFFPNGVLNEADVRRAAPGGEEDITYLVVPSRERALLLNKAYRALVLEQNFERGRDAVIRPTVNVHTEIVNGSTDLGISGLIFRDGVMWLDWE